MRRPTVLFVCVCLAAAFVACSSQSAGINPNVSRVSGHRHHRLRPKFQVVANTAQIGGQIDSIVGDEINIQNSSCGGGSHDDIYYNQGGVTTKFDPGGTQPTNGQYLRATGVMKTPIPCNVITSAAYITLSASPIPTVSAQGTITAVNPDGYSFTLTNGSTTHTVILNSYSNPTASPAVNDTTTVSGYGIPGSGHFIHATSVSFTTPSPGPTHVFTWDYGQLPGSPNPPYPAADLPYISLVQDSVTQNSSFYHSQSPPIKVEEYTGGILAVGSPHPSQLFLADGGNPNQQPQSSTDFMHDCNGNVVTGGAPTWYIQDFSKSAVITNAETYEEGPNFSTNFDYLFMDGPSHEYGLSATPCSGGTQITDTTFMNTLISGYGQFGVQVLVNGLDNVSSGQPCVCLTVAEGLAGGRMEQSYICPGNGQGGCANQAPSGAGYLESIGVPLWQGAENTEIDMGNANKLLLMEEYDNNVQPNSTTGQLHRMFGYASFLLTYNLNYSGIFYGAEGLGQGSNDPIVGGARLYPEVEVVPRNPVVATVQNNGISSLATSGVYSREYKDCYVAGHRVGRCLVAVNPDETSQHSFPNSAYESGCLTCHVLVLHNGSGGYAEIQNGGYVTEDGAAAPSMMGADTAVIVFDVSR